MAKERLQKTLTLMNSRCCKLLKGKQLAANQLEQMTFSVLFTTISGTLKKASDFAQKVKKTLGALMQVCIQTQRAPQ